MPAAVKVTRTTHTAEDLRVLARSGKDARQNARLLMAALVLEGVGRAEAGRMTGMDRQAVRDWAPRYNAEGPEGLRGRRRVGRACFLDEDRLSVVRGWVEAGPDPARDGVVRWRVRDIRRKIEEAFGVAYADESVRRLLRREGFRRVSGRPEHPRGDAVARSEFRSAFSVRVKARVREMLGSSALSQPVEVWFQDEARVGQKGMMSRLWARRGSRPRIVRDHRYGYRYLFGAACGSRGKAVGLVSERANTAATNAHPAAIGAAVAPGSVGVVVLDGAGWHTSRELAPPDNIVLLKLPPYSPELNPMETVFQYLKNNRLANRVFADVAAVADACRKAWEWFAATPDRIASIMRREWAIVPALAQISQNN